MQQKKTFSALLTHNLLCENTLWKSPAVGFVSTRQLSQLAASPHRSDLGFAPIPSYAGARVPLPSPVRSQLALSIDATGIDHLGNPH